MVLFLREYFLLCLTGSVAVIVCQLLTPLTRKILSAKHNLWGRMAAGLLFCLPLGLLFRPLAPATPPPLITPLDAVISALPQPIIGANTPEITLTPADPVPPISPATQPEPPVLAEKTAFRLTWQQAVFCLWGGGFVLALAIKLFWFARFSAWQKRQPRCTNAQIMAVFAEEKANLGFHRPVGLFQGDEVPLPLLAGLFSPRIYLPHQLFTPAGYRLILTHELTHAKRGDLSRKIFVQLICLVHWWNPLVYLLAGAINCWIELACDEEVLASAEPTQRQAYAFLLLDLMAGSAPRGELTFGLGLSQNAKGLKRRLAFITRQKPGRGLRKAVAAFSLILLVGVTGLLGACSAPAVNPSPESQSSYPTSSAISSATLSQQVASLIYAERGKMEIDLFFADKIQPDSQTNVDLYPLSWPVAGGGVITGGWQIFRGHNAMDIQSFQGDDIQAVFDGLVVMTRTNTNDLGNFILIQHTPDLYVLYANLETISVNEGQSLVQGQKIATMGASSPRALGVHLHLEVYQGGVTHNPANFFNREKMLDSASLPKQLLGRGGPLHWPLEDQSGQINQGWLDYPGHTGVDIEANQAAPVLAAASGTVVEVEYGQTGFGYRVVIEHSDGYRSHYAHLSSIDVTSGQLVVAGEKIGGVGKTGRTQSVALGFALFYQGQPLNPLSYWDSTLTPVRQYLLSKLAETV